MRLSVNGSRVYAVFDRWTGTVQNDANGQRYNSQLVIVRSDNAGGDGFTALGSGGNGVTAASHIGVFADAQNRCEGVLLGRLQLAADDRVLFGGQDAALVLAGRRNVAPRSRDGCTVVTFPETSGARRGGGRGSRHRVRSGG